MFFTFRKIFTDRSVSDYPSPYVRRDEAWINSYLGLANSHWGPTKGMKHWTHLNVNQFTEFVRITEWPPTLFARYHFIITRVE